ncbi:hypothetical protein [Streptomyces carpinensis]|uniref:acetyl-CoA C-acetyltransferase n=1 Tax=Streptomyces carpinensis TaxID=66369 RepID=A0ABV1VWF6_9ACTN|nr:hypothetical protein [Streptomyces carpinensis]
MGPDERILIAGGARTPVGSFGGAFKDVPAHELGAAAARVALSRVNVAPGDVDEAVMGCMSGPTATTRAGSPWRPGCR